MKKTAFTTIAIGAVLGLAACAPAAEETEVTPEAEPIEAEAPVAEEATEEATEESGEETAEEATGELDPDGNPVDQ